MMVVRDATSTYLTHQEWHALLHKLPDGRGILVQIATCKALVRAIEEGIVCALSHHRGNFIPLLRSRVDAGRVVRTRVQKEHRARGSTPQGGQEAREIQADCARVVVRVIHGLNTYILENSMVVCWFTISVDMCRMREV
jgi:hypothetical protein